MPTGMARLYPRRAAVRRGERALCSLGVLSPPAPERQPVRGSRTGAGGFSAALVELVHRTRQSGAQPVLLMTLLGDPGASGVSVRLATWGAYNERSRRAAAEQRVDLIELAGGAPGGA